jgi:hypothetical protein
MKLHCLSDYDYNNLVFKSILSFGGFSPTITVSDTGIPSIGYRFNLQDDRVLFPVLASLGFDVYGKTLNGDAAAAEKYYIDLIRSAVMISNGNDADSLNHVIQNILAARAKDKRYAAHPDFHLAEQLIYRNESELGGCLQGIIKNYEKTVDQWLMSFDLQIIDQNPQFLARKSRERAVLFSLAYQGEIGLKADKQPSLQALGYAIAIDNRPEAWFQIRYNAFSNGGKTDKVVMRRYYESELFGLYDEGVHSGNIGNNQCKEIYSMFHDHKSVIIPHEKAFSIKIPQANQDYHLSGSAKIKTLEQSFQPAYNRVRCNKSANGFEDAAQRQLLSNNAPVLKPWKTAASADAA